MSHNPILSFKIPYPSSSDRIHIIQLLGARSSRTSNRGDPSDATRSNTGLGHDVAFSISRLKHQIVHALGTELRVHSSECKRCGPHCSQQFATLLPSFDSCMLPCRADYITLPEGASPFRAPIACALLSSEIVVRLSIQQFPIIFPASLAASHRV